MSTTPQTLRLGTRGSMLAKVQSGQVADELEKRHPGLHVELCIYKTTGDQIADRPLSEAGGKGLFVKDIEQALLDQQVEFAVHSFKDVPVTMPLVEQENLVVAAVPPREDVRDLLISLKARALAELPPGARVGTGSLRRQAQLLALRPDLQVEAIRGNIDTRLRKVQEEQFDAIILAMAGIKRAGLFDSEIMTPIDLVDMLPAAGQGALSLQCRRDDQQTRQLLSVLHEPLADACVRAERQLVRLLDGDCFSPIAAHGRISDGQLELRAAIGRHGGGLPLLRAEMAGPAGDPEAVAAEVFARLLCQGVRSHLHG
jgi:hydroxymethylbilane synthase